MKNRVYIVIGAALAVLLVCTYTPFVAVLFSFLVMGMIPGTGLVIPSWIILIANPLLCIGVLAWISDQSLFIGEVKKKPASRKRSVSKKVVKRTRKSPTIAHTTKRKQRVAI